MHIKLDCVVTVCFYIMALGPILIKLLKTRQLMLLTFIVSHKHSSYKWFYETNSRFFFGIV